MYRVLLYFNTLLKNWLDILILNKLRGIHLQYNLSLVHDEASSDKNQAVLKNKQAFSLLLEVFK